METSGVKEPKGMSGGCAIIPNLDTSREYKLVNARALFRSSTTSKSFTAPDFPDSIHFSTRTRFPLRHVLLSDLPWSRSQVRDHATQPNRSRSPEQKKSRSRSSCSPFFRPEIVFRSAPQCSSQIRSRYGRWIWDGPSSYPRKCVA